jgi:DNA-binding NarL/FixJ family response regulator
LENMVLEAQSGAPDARPIRVLLIDDEAVIRAGLRVLIDSWAPSQVVGEADSAQQALAAIDAVQPNLIVCSHTGRSNGFADGLRHLTKNAGDIPVVLLTGSRKPEVHALAIEAGAKWIVSTKDAAMELRSALERVHSGERWLGHTSSAVPAISKTRNRWNPGKSDADQRLTNRERDVAALVSQGWTNRQVGRRLGITEVTVRHHLSSIFNKLRITNRFQLIAWLYRQGPAGPAQMA